MIRSLACLLALSVACAGPPAADTGAPEDAGDFVVSYEDPAPDDGPVAALVRESGIVEEMVQGLNETYALPDDIAVVFTTQDPEESGPYYDPEDNSIAMPYPYLTADRAMFAEYGYESQEDIDDAVLSDAMYTLYHEVGHALIANLELPVTGREEDAVDGLAAVILTETYEGGGDIVLAAADWFAAASEGREEGYGFSDYADTHSLDEQRYITLLCLVHGSDPEAYADLVDPEYLPPERAEGCEAEYAQAQTAWDELLAPYVKS